MPGLVGMVGLALLGGAASGWAQMAAPAAGTPPASGVPAPDAAKATETLDGAKRAAPEDVEGLTKRAAEYWKAKANGDWAKTYEYLEPDARKVLTVESYLKSVGGINYKEANIQRVEIDGDKADVVVGITYTLRHPRLMNMKPQSRDVRDGWKKVDGVWYKTREAAEAGKSPLAEMLKQLRDKGFRPSPGAAGMAAPGAPSAPPGDAAQPSE